MICQCIPNVLVIENENRDKKRRSGVIGVIDVITTLVVDPITHEFETWKLFL
jgi:hypothetical protein